MEFLSIILWIIGAIVTWSMISHGFAIANRIAAASEATAMSTSALYFALTPEAKERADVHLATQAKKKAEHNNAITAYKERRFFITIIVVGIMVMLFWSLGHAHAQGIYMLNGRATPSVIVGPDGGIWPVVPNPCYGGPCPVITPAPLPWRAPARLAVPPPYAVIPPYGPPVPPCDCRAY